jgi:hypothetical protein
MVTTLLSGMAARGGALDTLEIHPGLGRLRLAGKWQVAQQIAADSW